MDANKPDMPYLHKTFYISVMHKAVSLLNIPNLYSFKFIG